MIALGARNVCGLLPIGLDHLRRYGVLEETRAGRALVMPSPVMSVYERPTERVLLSPVRDANPFFHLMESLWMLAGRDDAAFLDHYVRDFGERFADHGQIHGAYGMRWRRNFGFDQLDAVVHKLRKNHGDRQAVIQMWDAYDSHELYGGSGFIGQDDLLGTWKDRPCNTHVYLRVRSKVLADYGGGPPGPGPASRSALDLTVCCRSNDLVWGAHGANAVHFSMLQEYLAGRIGVGVGRMYQLSNNYHGYCDQLDRLGDPRALLEERDPYDETNPNGGMRAVPIGDSWIEWDHDLEQFMEWHDRLWNGASGGDVDFVNRWFKHTAICVAYSNFCRVRGKDNQRAIFWAKAIESPDWRRACVEWLQRRNK